MRHVGELTARRPTLRHAHLRVERPGCIVAVILRVICHGSWGGVEDWSPFMFCICPPIRLFPPTRACTILQATQDVSQRTLWQAHSSFSSTSSNDRDIQRGISAIYGINTCMYVCMYMNALRAGRHRVLSTSGGIGGGRSCWFSHWLVNSQDGMPTSFVTSVFQFLPDMLGNMSLFVFCVCLRRTF